MMRTDPRAKRAGWLALFGAVLASPAAAQTATPELSAGDTAWMLTASVIVLMMTIPGLALFYGGMVRKKNVLATVMQSFAVCCLATIVWFVIGYSIAFGGEGSYIGGFEKMFLAGVTPEALSGTIPETVFIMFQMTFAIITPALIVGAVAERMKFSAVLAFLGVWMIVVYAPVAHWVWGSGGFLGAAGVLDYAGGTVVHINSGIGALVLCIVMGKRIGYGRENLQPHNLVLTMIGASLLWVGWFGFNSGSALSAGTGAGVVMVNTQIATAGAALTWMFAEWVATGKPSVLGILTGAIAGLVGITPACGFVGFGGALAIGVITGFACFIAVTWLKHKLGYDDSLDVFGVHGVGGAVGALLTGVFATSAVGGEGKSGLIDGNAAQLGLQAYGVAVTIVYCAVASFVIIKVLDMLMKVRVGEEEEREGLDIRLHGESVA
jgi:Amt family ammonium transporter